MYQARIRMPRMGTSVHEGTVVEWKKTIGDRVSKGEPLLSAESDKVEFEVESPADGVMKEILAEAETTVAVGGVLAVLETEEEVFEEESATSSGPPKSDEWAAPVAPLRPAAERESAPSPVPATPSLTAGTGGGLLSPRVQRLAAKHGLDLTTVSAIPGTGAGGRVTARDVEQYLKNSESIPTINLSFHPISKNEAREIQAPFSRLRKRITDNLTRSVLEIPQVTSFFDVDMSRLAAWRDANKISFQDKHGVKLTYTSFFALAIISALRESGNERFNGSCEENELIIKRYVNLGVAVDTPDGLMVPVAHEVDSLNFVDLILRLEDIASRARAGKLSPDEGKDGTITLTNFGTSGAITGNPLINPPEVAIIGTGAIATRAVALTGGGFSARPMMTLAITFDHRANDGMAAGRFAASIREALEGMNLSQLEY